MKKKVLILIIIVIILFVSIIYYQNYLTKNRITSSTVKATGSVIQEIEEKEEVEEKEIIQEEVEKTKEVSEEPFPETFLTDAECIDGKEITFTLNNILNKQIIPSKLTFYAAGYTIRNPVCDKTELNPKESTDCKLNLRIKLNKIIKFTIAYPAKSQSVNIDCG